MEGDQEGRSVAEKDRQADGQNLNPECAALESTSFEDIGQPVSELIYTVAAERKKQVKAWAEEGRGGK